MTVMIGVSDNRPIDEIRYAHKPRVVTCPHRCACPHCGSQLSVEEHGAHYCVTCQKYVIPNPKCPGW
ncbi:MAG: hypothetical protein EHM35_08535 [Planctomycetaceae bacterium]|nr:MAG: hypothetical protein EHM35_08535 [Planctomycetaceae bacterium]